MVKIYFSLDQWLEGRLSKKKSSTSGDGIIHKIKIMLQILMTREIA